MVVLVSAAVMAVIALGGAASGAEENDTPAPTATSEALDGPTSILAMTTNMYARPSQTGDLLAIIPGGHTARVTGRTENNDWLRVIYPRTSTLEGWIPRTSIVAVTEPDLAALPSIPETAGVEDDPGAGPLLDDDALPDLAVASVDVQPNGILHLRITNVGRSTFAEVVDIHVASAEGELLGVLDVDLGEQPLAPGRSASVNTGVPITRTGLHVIEVDRLNQVEEESEFNNARRVLLVGVES